MCHHYRDVAPSNRRCGVVRSDVFSNCACSFSSPKNTRSTTHVELLIGSQPRCRTIPRLSLAMPNSGLRDDNQQRSLHLSPGFAAGLSPTVPCQPCLHLNSGILSSNFSHLSLRSFSRLLLPSRSSTSYSMNHIPLTITE